MLITDCDKSSKDNREDTPLYKVIKKNFPVNVQLS